MIDKHDTLLNKCLKTDRLLDLVQDPEVKHAGLEFGKEQMASKVAGSDYDETTLGFNGVLTQLLTEVNQLQNEVSLLRTDLSTAESRVTAQENIIHELRLIMAEMYGGKITFMDAENRVRNMNQNHPSLPYLSPY